MEKIATPVVVFSLATILLVILGGFCMYIGTWFKSSNRVEFTSTGPTIERVQALGELVVLRVSVGDVLTGATADYKGSWLIKGDALVSVNMRKASVLSSNELAKRVVIEVPEPQVIQPRVDHARTKTWEVKKTSWIPYRGDPDVLRDQSMAQAQRLVEHTVSQEETIELAKTQTRHMLRVMYQFVEWDVEIVWACDGSVFEKPETDSNGLTALAASNRS